MDKFMKRKKIVIISCLSLLFMLCCSKIYVLNSTCQKPEIEIYESNISVPIGENFYANASEDLDGFEFIVHNAKIYTYEQYLDQFDLYNDNTSETEAYTPQYVYDVEVTIRNVYNNNTDPQAAAINLVTTVLKSSNHQIQVNGKLFSILYPQLRGAYGFKLRTESEMTFHFPYTAIQEYDDKCDRNYYESEEFYLLISMYPTEKMIRVNTIT